MSVSPEQQRGSIRPPQRSQSSLRPLTRSVGARPISMDGVVRVPNPAIATPVEAAPVKPLEAEAKPVEVVVPVEPPKKKAHRAKRKKARLEKAPAEGTKRFDIKTAGLVGLACAVLVLTGYVGLQTWLTNSKAEAVLSKSTAATDADVATSSKDDEGKDETAPTKNSLANYVVGPTLPRALYIDKLSIAARIMPMSVNTDGSVQAPKNIYDSGWYNGSVKPGETGAMFIDGHASGPTRQGLFAYLDTLKKGDTIQVEKGSGEKLTYKVVNTEVVPLNEVDMKKVLLPYGNTLKGLNMMTCTGKWLPLEKTYDHRVIVYAAQV